MIRTRTQTVGLIALASVLILLGLLAWHLPLHSGSVKPLGDGCYYAGVDKTRQVCDEWRKAGSTLPVPNPSGRAYCLQYHIREVCP